MRRATKWLVFLLIMTMLTAAMLAGTVTVLADETQPPAESTTEVAPALTGKIDAVIWDDSINPDGVYSSDELIDGITVDLYKEEEDGTWTLISRKKTGPGSFLNDPLFDYKHGWVGWDNLPLDEADPVLHPFGRVTRYKLELVYDNTYKPVNGPTRIAELTPWNFYHQFFYPMAWYEGWSAPQITSTTVTVAGMVWSDANADQVRQWAEQAKTGWNVMLTNKYGSRIATTKTDVNGYYQFRGLKSGTYKVWVASVRGWKQVAPYYRFFTWPPYGYEKGHHAISGVAGKYYFNNDFGMLDMKDSVWAPLYYVLWWIGLLQYQFK